MVTIDFISFSLLLVSNNPPSDSFQTPFPFSFNQTMVKVRVQPLHSMASSIAHDFFRQEAITLHLLCVLNHQGRDVTRTSHTSRL